MSVAPPDAFGCCVWTGPRTHDGYGLDGKRLAHVVAWEGARGPVPEGKYLDHRCRNRACRRLAHLHVVSKSDNEKAKLWRWRVRQPVCDAGHANDKYNAVVTPAGGRVCRACNALEP